MPLAGMDARLALATEQELVAPPAFPWSYAAASRLPRATVSAVAVHPRPPSAETVTDVAETLTQQAPALARPFTLPTSPPYLMVPLAFKLHLTLDDEGRVASAAVTGAPGELDFLLAERAAALVFPPSAGGAAVSATLTLTPYHYDRLLARRHGLPLPAADYELLYRALQFGTYGFADACRAYAPALLRADAATKVSFRVGPSGHPERVAFSPPLGDEKEQLLADALGQVFLPRRLAGAEVTVLLGSE